MNADDLLSEDDLFETSFPIRTPKFCGLYFLFQDDELVYVGKTTRLLTRVQDHLSCTRKTFNRIALLPVKRDELARMEALYINRYLPAQNLAIPLLGRIQYEPIYADGTVGEIADGRRRWNELWN